MRVILRKRVFRVDGGKYDGNRRGRLSVQMCRWWLCLYMVDSTANLLVSDFIVINKSKLTKASRLRVGDSRQHDRMSESRASAGI